MSLGLDALAYEFDDADRWTRTATSGSNLTQGQPTIVTWSFAPDGTNVPNGTGGTEPSQLISFLDGIYGGSGSDLTQRAWFTMFQESFDRWAELSGLTFVYEPEDDGNNFNSLNTNTYRGVLGRRGDIRIGATSVDGSSGTIAFAYKPNYGELVLDSDNISTFSNTANDSRAPRNVIMHEVGHTLGIDHLESSNAAFLMEPFLSTAYDGPQLDDILAIQRGYGDFYEKSNNGQGNNSAVNATDLGLLVSGQAIRIGTHANDTLVARTDTDFVSIDDNSDIDFFRFTIDAASTLDLTLTPKGPTYNSGPEDGTQNPLNTAALSNLAITLFDINGSTPLMSANVNPAGLAEAISGFVIDDPGTYFVRITGVDDAIQLYQLDLLAIELEPVAGDLDGDRDVDQDDLMIVMANFNTAATPGSLLDGDPTGDGQVGILDMDFVLARWTPPLAATVPEPASLMAITLLGLCARRQRRGS